MGEAPGRTDRPGLALAGVNKNSAGGRLRALSGLTLEEWDRVVRLNLIPFFPEKFPTKLASQQAQNLCSSLLRDRRVILCGARVARAFGVKMRERPSWVRSPYGPVVAVIPHPSGRNLLYNDEDVRRVVGAFLRRALTR